jgi:hypothetical protein
MPQKKVKVCEPVLVAVVGLVASGRPVRSALR